MELAKFRKLPIMGILRGIKLSDIEPLLEAVIDSGLVTIEVTMNTLGAPELIRRAKALSKKRLMIGAGTVLDMPSLRQALDAGATFIVTPVLIKEVMAYCLKNKIPVFPGALTPLEIYNAWREGAAMVKVFPAGSFGPDYFKEIRGPFEKIELLACSGVSPDNLAAYFSNGASAVSFGANVFRPEWLRSGDFKSIKESIKGYLRAFSRFESRKIKL